MNPEVESTFREHGDRRRHLIFRWILLTFLSTGLIASLHFGVSEFLTIGFFQQRMGSFQRLYAAQPSETIAVFLGIYVLITASSIPGATVLALAAGALFGFSLGTILVSFASTLGATLALLVSRHLLRDFVRSKFPARMEQITEGFQKGESLYLLSLRLVPVFPFFLVNLSMGLTSIHPFKFAWLSQIGMLPGTLIYVNAGTQLAKISSVNDVFTPSIAFSLALIGIVPILIKVASLRGRKKPGGT